MDKDKEVIELDDNLNPKETKDEVIELDDNLNPVKKKEQTVSSTGGSDAETTKSVSVPQSTSIKNSIDLNNASIVQNKVRDLLKNNDSPAVKDAITKALSNKGYNSQQVKEFSDNVSNAKKVLSIVTPALNNQQQAQPYEDENPATAEVRMEQVPKTIEDKPELSYASQQTKAQSESDIKDRAKANEQAQKNTIPQNAYLAGRAYTTLGDSDKAIQMYNTALGNLSKDIESNGRQVYAESGVNTPNTTDAMVQKTTMPAGHNPANILNGLGQAWAQKRDDEKALDYYTQSLKYMGYTPPETKGGQPDKTIVSEQQGEESPESIALKGIASIKHKQGDIEGSQQAIKLANNELSKNQQEYGLAHNIEINKADDIANARRSNEIGDVASGLEEFVKGEGKLGILNPIGQMISGVQRGGLTIGEGVKQFSEGMKQDALGQQGAGDNLLGGAITVVNGVAESAFAGLPEAQQFNTLLGGAKDVINSTLDKDTADVLNKTLDVPFQFASTIGGMLGWNPDDKSNSKKFQQLLDTLVSFPLMAEGHKMISGQPTTIQEIIQKSKDKKSTKELSDKNDFYQQAYNNLSGANIGDIVKQAEAKGYTELATQLKGLTAEDLANRDRYKEASKEVDGLHETINSAGFNVRTPEAQKALQNAYKQAQDKLHSIGKEDLDSHLSDVESAHKKAELEDKISANKQELNNETNPFAKEALQKVVDGLKEELTAYQVGTDAEQGLNKIQNLKSKAKGLLATEPPIETPDTKEQEVVSEGSVGVGGDKKYLTDSDMPEITGLKVRLNVNKELKGKEYDAALGKIKEFLLDYFKEYINKTRDGKDGDFAAWDKEGTNIFKILSGGEKHEKDSTVYVGDHETAKKLAEAVSKNKELQQYLDTSETPGDNVIVSDFIKGRLDIGDNYNLAAQITKGVGGRGNFWDYIKRKHPELIKKNKDGEYIESENYLAGKDQDGNWGVFKKNGKDFSDAEPISFNGDNYAQSEQAALELINEVAPELTSEQSLKETPKAETPKVISDTGLLSHFADKQYDKGVPYSEIENQVNSKSSNIFGQDAKEIADRLKEKGINVIDVPKETVEPFDGKDYSKGRTSEQVANDNGLQLQEHEKLRHIAEESENPLELATEYLKLNHETPLKDFKSQLFNEHNVHLTNADFDHYFDKNNKNRTVAKQYIRKDAIPLDEKMKELSDHYDIKIEPEDFINYIRNGEFKRFSPKEIPMRTKFKDRFAELTNGKDLTPTFAKSLLERELKKRNKEYEKYLNQYHSDLHEAEQQYYEQLKKEGVVAGDENVGTSERNEKSGKGKEEPKSGKENPKSGEEKQGDKGGANDGVEPTPEKVQESKVDLSLFKDVADKLYSLKKEPLTAKEKETIKQEVVKQPLEVRQSIDKAKKLMDELEKKGLIKTIKCK